MNKYIIPILILVISSTACLSDNIIHGTYISTENSNHTLTLYQNHKYKLDLDNTYINEWIVDGDVVYLVYPLGHAEKLTWNRNGVLVDFAELVSACVVCIVLGRTMEVVVDIMGRGTTIK